MGAGAREGARQGGAGGCEVADGQGAAGRLQGMGDAGGARGSGVGPGTHFSTRRERCQGPRTGREQTPLYPAYTSP
jgi:hypothetical protein